MLTGIGREDPMAVYMQRRQEGEAITLEASHQSAPEPGQPPDSAARESERVMELAFKLEFAVRERFDIARDEAARDLMQLVRDLRAAQVPDEVRRAASERVGEALEDLGERCRRLASMVIAAGRHPRG